jgi:hypothetical protein
VLVAILAGAGCGREASPAKLRVDPAALKAAREQAARDRAAGEQAADEARAKVRPPSGAEELRGLIAWRKEECEATGRQPVDDDWWMIGAALEENRHRGWARFGQNPDREQLKRSLSLIPAAARGDLAELRRLISRGADPNIDVPVDFALSPLAWAARCDQVEAVDLLVRSGARVNKPLGWGIGRANYTNSSALIWASRGAADRAVERLLQLGARPMREIVHSADGDRPGETPAEAAPTLALKRRLAR